MTLEERVAWLAAVERDPKTRALFWEACKDPVTGPALFVNVLGWSYDPRNREDLPEDEEPPEGAVSTGGAGAGGGIIGLVPFLLWPAQEDALRQIVECIRTGQDCGVEKSRDTGITWLVLYAILWCWFFLPGFSAILGTYVEDLLDDESDPDSLFWRLRHILRHLPDFLIPRASKVKTWQEFLDSKAFSSYCNLVNPDTGAKVNGRPPTSRFGIGGRRTCVYYDDFGRWDKEHAATAYKGTAGTTNCRLSSWTVHPEDPQNHCYELRFGKGKFEGTKTRIVNITWRDDPRKQRTALDPETGEPFNVWLRKIVGDAARGIPGRIPPTQFRRDYEMDYSVEAGGKIYSQQLVYVRRGLFPWDPALPLYLSIDPGVGDTCVLLWVQWDFRIYRYRLVDAFATSGKGGKYYVPIIKGRADKDERLELEAQYNDAALAAIERRTSWKQYSRYTGEWEVAYAGQFGDTAVKQRGASDGRSLRDVLADAGIHIASNEKKKGHFARILDTRRVLPYLDVNTEGSAGAAEWLEQMGRYQWNPGKTAPLHDESSHWATAFEFFCISDPHEDDLASRATALATGRGAEPGAIFGHPEHAQHFRDRARRVTDAFGGSIRAAGAFSPARDGAVESATGY